MVFSRQIKIKIKFKNVTKKTK